MKHCCEDKVSALELLRERQGRTLRFVLAINLVMFGVEVIAGCLAQSTAVLADALDMFGDALVYGFTLYVLDRTATWRAWAAMAKGAVMMLFGVAVLVEALFKILTQEVPNASIISVVGAIAVAANAGCLLLLLRHRHDDINMKSAWICSRNDIVANVAVVLAGLLVAFTGSYWPDVIVGIGIATLFLQSALGVSREAYGALRSQVGRAG